MGLKKSKSPFWPEMLILLLVSAFSYLPRIFELTYNKDDWYFMYDGLVRGAGVFRNLALHTRPLRGVLYELLYTLFGPYPFPYHLTSYVWRLLGSFGALWLFNLLWPNQRRNNVSLAVLFVIFPGFYWWVSGFELQPNIISIGLEAFSIALTLKAIEADSTLRKVLYIIASIATGWMYLSFVEYAIGMEGFRFLCVYVLVARKNVDLNLIQRIWKTSRTYAIFLVIPAGFLIWYEFFFENWRKAQNASLQLGALFNSPLTIFWWGVKVIESTLNISLLAWFVPFHENFLAGRLSDVFIGIFFSTLTAATVLIGNSWLQAGIEKDDDFHVAPTRTQLEMLWLGLLGTLAGVLPIVLANRSAVFSRVSQYTLPASLSAVLIIGGLLYTISPGKLKWITFSLLVGLATLSHHGLAARAVAEQKAISDFWWQVTWRAPDIRDDTLLVVRYPSVQYADNDEMVWGPANFIYNPEPQLFGPAQVLISAARMEPEADTDIIQGSKDLDKVDLVIKYTSTHYNYKNILVITQPVEQSCIHLIDSRWPDISIYDEPLIYIGASKSDTKNVNSDDNLPTPQKYIFGNEPRHEWCFYYQKADWARQNGNWHEVADLEQQATALGLHPNDQIEWMPFVQAYAFLGDEKQVKLLSTRINSEMYYKQEACYNLRNMTENGYPLSEKMQAYVDRIFCTATE